MRSVSRSRFCREVTLIFALSLAFIGTGCREERPDSGQAMLDALGSGCGSAGQWTQAALAQTSALSSLFKSLRDTDACKPYQATLGALDAATSQLSALVGDPTYANHRLAEEKLQELTSALSSTTDPALQSSLSTSVLMAQLELINARAARDSALSPERDLYARATRDFHNQVRRILTDTQGLGLCLKQSPAAAFQIAAGLAGTAGSFASPVVGAGMVALAGLAQMGIENVRQKASSEDLWRAFEIRMPTALACSLEGMTSFFCQAQDSYALLSQTPPTPTDPLRLPQSEILRVIDLLGRRLPVALSWLERVRSGGSANDSADAQRRNRILYKLGRLLPTRNEVDGAINEAERLSRTYPDEATRRTNFVTLVQRLSHQLAVRDDPTNPFNELTTDTWRYACFLLKGYSSAQACPASGPKPAPGNFSPTPTEIERWFTDSFAAQMNFESLRQGWETAFSTVTDLINRQFSEFIVIDARLLLVEGHNRLPSNYSPREVFDQILRYAQELRRDVARLKNPQIPKTLDETIHLLERSMAVLDNTQETQPIPCPPVPDPANPCDPTVTKPYTPVDKVAQIAAIFQLQTGTQYFSERVRRFAETDLLERLEAGQAGGIPDEVAEILRSSAGEIRTRLLAAGLDRETARIHQDLADARRIALENALAFRKAFAGSIENSLEKLKEGSQGGPGCDHPKKPEDRDRCASQAEPQHGAGRIYGQRLGQLCLLLVSLEGRWPSKKAETACQGALLESPYWEQHPELSVSLDQVSPTLARQKPEVRLCTYWRYLRSNRLADQKLPASWNP